MNNKVSNKLTPSLLGGGINSTTVCYNEKKGFKQLDSFYCIFLKEGLYL